MAIFRINKNKNYTVMSNHHLRNKSLSFKAKGLLSYMLSLPDDWDYSIEGLCKAGKNARSSVKTALNELKENGYLKIEKIMPNKSINGRIDYEYIIFEEPQNEKTRARKQPLENLSTENQRQLNTKEQNTKIKKNIKKKELNFEQREYKSEELEKLYKNI